MKTGDRKPETGNWLLVSPFIVIASPRNEGAAIQPLDRLGAVSLSNLLDGLLHRCAPANEHTLFVIAKEACRLRQSTKNSRWIATSLRSSR